MHHPSAQSCCARAAILLHVHTNVCVIQANISMNNMLDFTEFETYAAASRHNDLTMSSVGNARWIRRGLAQKGWGSHRVIISCSRRSLHQPPTQDSSHDPSKLRLSTMTFRMAPGGQEAGLSGQATRDKLAEDMYANDKKTRASISRPAKATKKVHDYMPTAVVSAF